MKKRTKNGDFFDARFCSSGKAAGPRRALLCPCNIAHIDGSRTQPGCKIAAKKRIELTFGKYAIVDAEDYDRLSKYKWHAVKEGRCWYAKTLRQNGLTMRMHRLITGAPKGFFVDHIDHNGLNNRKSNLRLCTHKQNSRNTRPRRGGTSKYKGVHWCKIRKKFRAIICNNSKFIHLGYFDEEIAAAKAYDRKALELFGQFAYLNFPNKVHDA